MNKNKVNKNIAIMVASMVGYLIGLSFCSTFNEAFAISMVYGVGVVLMVLYFNFKIK